ncbi:hypothetical protein EDC14_102359 [Hydrogenispora ethanolica]|jgi:radical SAM superfamily enzyme YgiQ (UPF0313 family)|uniref:Uncharacterized protein n=1 Tax=Hydrogenispora ethanolica TaxID=1082276 RepID=A0A4R1RAU5_HYDET|nr:hypothetical protein [Hydrogenispora ethanolica]TCL62779.1 hypothetical protein EDC14_102359 [Hydrogenispora ethanolica]
MISKNPTEELAYHLMLSKKNSFHFGEISLGVQKLLDALKELGYVVQFIEKADGCEPKLLSKEECLRTGLAFEHQVIDDRKHAN